MRGPAPGMNHPGRALILALSFLYLNTPVCALTRTREESHPMSSYKSKQMIVMRRDLKMRKGKIAAQAGHACVDL